MYGMVINRVGALLTTLGREAGVLIHGSSNKVGKTLCKSSAHKNTACAVRLNGIEHRSRTTSRGRSIKTALDIGSRTGTFCNGDRSMNNAILPLQVAHTCPPDVAVGPFATRTPHHFRWVMKNKWWANRISLMPIWTVVKSFDCLQYRPGDYFMIMVDLEKLGNLRSNSSTTKTAKTLELESF